MVKLLECFKNVSKDQLSTTEGELFNCSGTHKLRDEVYVFYLNYFWDEGLKKECKDLYL